MSTAAPKAAPTAPKGHQGTDLTVGSVPRHLVMFSIPMLLGSAIHTAYSIINAAWVGNGLGPVAMAAVTVSFPIFFLLMAVAGGLTLASSVLVSQAYGAKDIDRLKQVLHNSLILTALVGVVCLAIGLVTTEPALRLMQTPPDVLPIAVDYFRLLLWTIPFMFGVYFLASVMRGVGDSRTPLYFQAASLVLTAVLDPILMFGWLGFPRLGLNGTAVATIVAQAFAFVSIAAYIHFRGHIAAPNWRSLRIDIPTTRLTVRIGVPSMFQQALVSLGMLFIVGIVNRFGTHSAAALGIAMRIDQLAFMPAMTIGMAVSTLAGQNLGARRFDRVHSVFGWGIAVACGMTAVGTLLAMTIPHRLIGLFSDDADVIVTGAHYLRIVGAGYLLFAVLFVSNGVINGAGQTLVTTAFTLVTFWIVRVPFAYYLADRTGRVEGVWWAVLASLAVGAGLSLSYYLSGRWKRSLV